MLLAVSLAALMTIVAGSTDLARVYLWRNQAQIAADAAALAGASAFVDGTSTTMADRIAWYVSKNPVGRGHATVASVVVDSPARRVTVAVYYDSEPLFFATQGIRVRAQADGTLYVTNNTGVAGTPEPRGNAWGWWRQDRAAMQSAESVGVHLTK